MTRSLCVVLLFTMAASAHAQNAMKLRRLPMHFEENAGNGAFSARGADYAMFVTAGEAVMVLQRGQEPPATVRLKLRGADGQARVRGEHPLAAKSHYLIGNDPSQWRTNVAQYAKVRIAEVYRGIDAVYYGNGEELEYDFVVQPGADPRQIRLRFEGAERVEIDRTGDLVLHVRGGELRQRLPFVYQETGGRRTRVHALYRRWSAREFGFELAAYDPTIPLVIDPVLVYSTYLGGIADENGWGVAVDSAGNAYVAGTTQSSDFPTTAGAFQTSLPSPIAAYVTKFDPAGVPVYSTYLGGSGHTQAYALAVDSAGSAYVTGLTYDANFPIVNAPQSTHNGLHDAFVTKLNPAGSAIVYSTFIGGQISDAGYGIGVDSAGNAYVTGETNSFDFPTVNAFQTSMSGPTEGFVAKLNPAGSAFVYLTFLGGSSLDRGTDVEADPAGNAYVTGFTLSANFPTANAFQATYGGNEDAFVTKINPAGSALVYSTYLGGSSIDNGNGIAVDASGSAVVTGWALSTDFPTANALQAANAGSFDAFVTKLNSAGSAVLYSTYLGGSQQEAIRAIAMDPAGNVYITGSTGSTDFPTVNPVQAAHAGGSIDAVVAALNASGSALIYSTYLGGSGFDSGLGIGVSPSGTAVIAGETSSTDYPTLNAFQPAPQGAIDAFVTAIGMADLAITKTHTGNFVEGQSGEYTITVTNVGTGDSSGLVTVTDTLPPGLTATSISGAGWTCTLATLTCTRSDVLPAGASFPPITLVVDIAPGTVGPLTNTATVSGGGNDPNPGNSTTTDVANASVGAGIPFLDPRALAMLSVLLAAVGIVALRR
jgi:uncharacterized repeat protein (TIGR01451 family)